MLLTALTLLLFKDVSKSSAILAGDNSKQAFFEKLNLLLLVKASQSSNHRLSDLSYSKSRLEIVQDSISSVLELRTIPPNVDLGIMAYGHKIDRTDFSRSCSPDNVELVVPMQPVSPNINLENFLTITGLGEVPAAVALEEASKVFTQISPEVLNVILLIADSSDTCNQNPEETARELADSKKITIHTIGFMADVKVSNELQAIANQASGNYIFISPYIDDNEVATAELTEAISILFEDLLSQIAIQTQPIDTTTPTDVASPAPISTETPKPTSTLTKQPTQPALATISPAPVPAEDQPSSPTRNFGTILGLALVFMSVLAFGLWLRRSKPAKSIKVQTIKFRNSITPEERLEEFRKDLYQAYNSTGASVYIPLKLLEEKLSGKYSQKQFDELLTQAKQQYPKNIWIDRDREPPQIFINTVRRWLK